MKEFISKSSKIAIVGASANPDKWGYKIYKKLKNVGFMAFPVNPKCDKIDDEKCYGSIGDIPKKPDIVITIVPPRITETVIEECKRLGIKKVWIQPGSESENAIKFCEENGIEVVNHACFVVDGMKDGFSE